MKPRTFSRLVGLFALLIVSQTAATEAALFFLAKHSGSAMPWRTVLAGALFAGAAGVGLAAWAASGVSMRLRRLVEIAQQIASGELGARTEKRRDDELSGVENALNQTAMQLAQRLGEIENRRLELTAMLDSMQEAVIAVTQEGAVRWANTTMQRVAGAQIRPGRPVVHAVRDPEVLACLRGVLETGALRSGRATSLGAGRVYEISAAPLPSGGALAVLHDVTAIETAEKSRREFIANVSHELRTPLTSIQGYAETLMDEPTPDAETAREFLQVIHKNATRMNRLTEDLLALASIEGTDYKLTPKPMRADGLVEDSIAPLRMIAEDAGVQIESTGAPERLVMADADATTQVFGNLVENALKYGKAGKRIRVGARVRENEVQFSVQDFGPGIASEHLDRIFERFYRIDKARSRESGGTGLGLAIVKHLVQAQGGHVWAESELGKGAAFHFTLPMAAAPEISMVEPPATDGSLRGRPAAS